MKRALVLGSIAMLALGGCSKANPDPVAPKATAATDKAASGADTPASTDKNDGAAEKATAESALRSATGKVLETMNASGYTYVRIDSGAGEVWAAGPETKVAVGDEVSFAGGVEMKNFHSKTLDRSFEVVFFVGALNVAGAAAASAGDAAGHGAGDAHGGAAGQGAADPHGIGVGHSGTAPPAATNVAKIAKAPGGKTVAEVFAGKDKLSGQVVVVRAKVTKYTSGIMRLNWLHLQDGTGAPGKNDLVVTTNETANVGDVVTVRGKVVTNKDFGAGYRYDVLLQEATVTVK